MIQICGQSLVLPFLAGDSCIAQLLSTIHEIQTNFDENPATEVRGVVLDISKTFDKVWHDGIIFYLKAYGVGDELLSLLKNYLENREQGVVLNSQISECRKKNSIFHKDQCQDHSRF